MMTTFCYNQTNIYKFIQENTKPTSVKLPNTPLRIVMDDMFVGTRKSSLKKGEKGNKPLMISKMELPSTQNIHLFRLLFSEDILGKSRNGKPWADSSLRAFLGGAVPAGSFGPGENIISSFLKDVDECINKIVENINCNFYFVASKAMVAEYFEKLLIQEKFIFSKLQDEESKEVYRTFLENGEFDQLLARILLSMVFSTESFTRGPYELSEQKANLIWALTDVRDYTCVGLCAYSNEVWFCNARKWYEIGRYQESYNLIQKLIEEAKFDDIQSEQNIRYLYACHLFEGRGCEKDVRNAIFEYEQCSRHKEAQYFLACYYFGMYEEGAVDFQEGVKYLMRAAELGHIQAQLDEIHYILRREKTIFSIMAKRNAKLKVKRWEESMINRWDIVDSLLQKIKKESCHKDQLSTYFYLNGLIHEYKRSEQADSYFKEAYELGHSEAARKLRFQKIEKHINKVKELENGSKTVFLTNSVADKVTANFIKTHSNINLFTTADSSSNGVKKMESIGAFINEIFGDGLDIAERSYDRYTAFFFSDDEEKNLYDTLELLEELYNSVMEMDIASRKELIESIDIFFKCNHEQAAMFVDATLNKMLENTYFKVHICDPDRDAAHELLYKIPLFMPFIQQAEGGAAKKKACNVVVFGASTFVHALAKEITALGYMGERYPLTLSLIGNDAEVAEEQFFCNLPGLYQCRQQLLKAAASGDKMICRPKSIVPRFYEGSLERLNLSSIIKNKKNPLHDIVTAGNYFVVDVGTDFQNIQFAINLRRELLKSTPKCDKAPLIAVKCSNSKAAYAVDNALVDNKPQGNEFWNKYDFKFFGMADVLYSYESMILNNPLEELSCEIHCCYDEEALRENPMEVLNNYYSSQYNQDSSKATAIGLRYRLFVADLYEAADNHEPMVFSFEKDQALSAEYTAWLSQPNKNNADLAGSIEQTRWNGFMLSRGWEPASLNQVAAYKNQASAGQHKHRIAKLHPFICDWEELSEMDDECFIVSLRNKFAQDPETKEYTIENPKETTLKSVYDTATMLSLKHIK